MAISPCATVLSKPASFATSGCTWIDFPRSAFAESSEYAVIFSCVSVRVIGFSSPFRSGSSRASSLLPSPPLSGGNAIVTRE